MNGVAFFKGRLVAGRDQGSGLRAARKARGERLEPRTELIEARGHGLGALFGGVGALALGRRLVAGFGQIVGDGQARP